jgi:hypothetical protein
MKRASENEEEELNVGKRSPPPREQNSSPYPLTPGSNGLDSNCGCGWYAVPPWDARWVAVLGPVACRPSEGG